MHNQKMFEHGMVTAQHPLGVSCGVEVLKRGGNAIDAAVTTSLAMGVLMPFSNGLGGIGMMVVYLARTGETVSFDFGMRAAKAAKSDMYELEETQDEYTALSGSLGWPAVKGRENEFGYRSIAVPGALLGLNQALSSHGTISLEEAFQPAIQLAEEGFPIDKSLVTSIRNGQEGLSRFPATGAIFLPDGRPPSEGERFVQRDLAETMKKMAREGPEVLYGGALAEAIEGDMAANGGLLTREDFSDYRVKVHRPGLVTDYRGHRIVGVPEMCGGPTVGEILNILEGYDMGELACDSLDALYLTAEAIRHASADRFTHLGDSEQVAVPWKGLLSKEYAAKRREDIRLDRAQEEAQAGDPWAFEGSPRAGSISPSSGDPGPMGGTTHLSVVDRDRNMVALTATNKGHSRVVVPGLGIMMNNGMRWFCPVPGRANSIGPGKKALSNMTPVVVLKDDRPYFCVGASGGRRIWPAIAQIVSMVIDFGMGIEEAIGTPRIHCEMAQVQVGAGIPETVLEGLAHRGHRVVPMAEATFSSPNGIMVDPETGMLSGGTSSGSPGLIGGYG